MAVTSWPQRLADADRPAQSRRGPSALGEMVIGVEVEAERTARARGEPRGQPERKLGSAMAAELGNMRVTEQTVWNWINATREPLSHHVVTMLNYFDASFAREIGIDASATRL